MREETLLQSLRSLLASPDPSVLTGSGPDDCAHVKTDGDRLAMTIDSFIEHSHFLPGAPAAAVAEKALAASVSDLAASACRARWALVSLCLRPGLPESWAGEFAAGLAATARRYGVTVVGGDTTSGPALAVSVAAVGEPLPGGPLLRSGARPGDVLAVTGSLGGSLAGRHLAPVPRLAEIGEIMALCRRAGVEPPSAAMDISDGLALDLSRLCRESGVRGVVEEARIPISDDARRLAAADGSDPLRRAYADGEDFELLLALPPPTWQAIEHSWPDARRADPDLAPLTRIGCAAAGAGLAAVGPDGRERPLDPEGYQHQW